MVMSCNKFPDFLYVRLNSSFSTHHSENHCIILSYTSHLIKLFIKDENAFVLFFIIRI